MILTFTPADLDAPIPPITRHEADVVTRAVIARAHDEADRDELLGMLGLGGSVRRRVTTLACGHPSTEAKPRTSSTIGRGVDCRACRRGWRS